MLTLNDAIEALTTFRPVMELPVITEAAIDSRQVIPGSLFVAIPGENVDGHDFVSEAFRRGASFALIQHDLQDPHPTLDLRKPLDPDSLQVTLSQPCCLYVENTLLSLQQIARFWRHQLDLRVIGITGSVGKSTTKEVAAEVLSQRYRTLKNPGNQNNEIGLPLSILRLGRGYEVAVLEMGFYVPGEIALLCDIASPQVGVVTNIGTVHAQRAGSKEAIVRGKTELVEALPPAPEGVAILNFDDPWVRQMAQKTRARILFYGLDPQAELWADQVESMGLDGIHFHLHYHDEVIHVRVPLIGQHSVHTALRAAAIGLVEGMTWQEIMEGLRAGHTQLRLVAVRSENGALLLDDTYNASPESTIAALNLLAELGGHRVAVLGDMLELGPYEKQGHEIVGVRVAEIADLLVTVGERGRLIADAARKAGLRSSAVTELETTDQAIEYLRQTLTEDEVVLVKGSHGIRMDRIVAALETQA